MSFTEKLKDLPANILVVGGGGIGTITALNLVAGGLAQVSLVLRSNYDVVREHGYHIDSVDHGVIEKFRPHHVFNKIPCKKEDDSEPFDYIVCTIKNIMENKQSTVDLLRPAITPSLTTIVLIQNGLNIEKPYLTAFPNNVVLSGISYMGSHERAHGVIEQNYPDKLELAVFFNNSLDARNQQNTARDFMSRYQAGGKTDVSLVDDVSLTRWTKLLYNATINPLSAILQMSQGELDSSAALSTIAHPAMAEICLVARANSINIEDQTVASILEMSTADVDFQPSMCVDILKGNLIEYESIVGEPMREARRLGVETPTLDLLYNLCRALQWRARERANKPK